MNRIIYECQGYHISRIHDLKLLDDHIDIFLKMDHFIGVFDECISMADGETSLIECCL
jgi:hypothetical protein